METQEVSKSVANGLAILPLFTSKQPTWGVTDIANELGLYKSTVSRLVKELGNETTVFIALVILTMEFSFVQPG